MVKKIFITTIAATVLSLVISAGVCFGDKIKEPVTTWKQTEFQGKISYISPAGDYIIASERKVVLVDMTYNTKHYVTNILDADGRSIRFEDLAKGMWVFVRGGIMPDNIIGARTIYLLPSQLNDKKMKEDYPALKELQRWGE